MPPDDPGARAVSYPGQAAKRPALKILMLEDEATDAELITRALRQGELDFISKRVATRDAFVAALEGFMPDVVLADYKLPNFNGAEALAYVRQVHPEIPVVMVTGALGDEGAIELLKAGAKDYVLKRNLVRLPSAVERAIAVEQGIRARKAAEQAVRLNEERYRTLVQATSQVVWTTDAHGNVLDDSPGWRALTGLTIEQLKGTGWVTALHPDDVKRTLAVWSRAVDARKPYDTEFRTRRRDGEYRYMAARGVPLLKEDGTIREWIGTCTDITERKRAENTIREEEAKFRSLVEQNVAGVAIIREDGTIGYINPYFAGLAGYSATEMIGRPLLDFLPETEKPTVLEKLHGQFSGAEGAILLPTAMLAHDGHRTDILVSATPSIYEGRPASIAVVLDVTERKRAEEDLRASEERFRLVIENAPDAIMLYDRDQDRFISANKAAERLFGCARDEIVKYGPRHFYAPEQPDGRPVEQSFAEHNERASAGGGLIFERRFLTAAGEERLCEVTLVPLSSAGARLLRASMVDITEQREAERALQRLNRTLRTLSRGNEVLVRATGEPELLQEMCQVIVESGGYRMAWIGIAQHDAAKSVTPAASAGEAGDYLDKAQISWADEPRGQGMVGRAIRSGEPQTSQNIAADPKMAPWQEEARQHAFASSIALPLKDASSVFAALTIYSAEVDAFNAGELALLQELASDLAFGIRSQREHVAHEALSQRWRTSLEATVGAIANTVEMRDPYTAGHQQRVARLAVAIARKLALPEQQIEGLYLAGIIHDVGKVNIPTQILNKPGKLSKLEYQLIQEHAEAGYDIIKGVDFPWPIADMVRQHHERLDGSGYPQGLTGDAILPEAKILAIADVVESMMSHRPYRPALGIEVALAEIEKGKGRIYDAAAVEACLALFHEQKFTFE